MNEELWSRYREYPAKRHQRKRHISASRNDNLILKKVPGRTFQPILSILDSQHWFWKNKVHRKSELRLIFEKNHFFSTENHQGFHSISLLFIIKLCLMAGNGTEWKIFSWKFSFCNVLWVFHHISIKFMHFLQRILERKCCFWPLIV